VGTFFFLGASGTVGTGEVVGGEEVGRAGLLLDLQRAWSLSFLCQRVWSCWTLAQHRRNGRVQIVRTTCPSSCTK
jgi:hypothetical protein